jgi:hypothetical protein
MNDPAVPDWLRREVLKEYGLNNIPDDTYEIDYLVTPQLGGATDIRNLWPEPSLDTVWNAHVKDALENRLQHLVCTQQLDLATAQRELSQDWVAAYKKYFHTNEPLSAHSIVESHELANVQEPVPVRIPAILDLSFASRVAPRHSVTGRVFADSLG